MGNPYGEDPVVQCESVCSLQEELRDGIHRAEWFKVIGDVVCYRCLFTDRAARLY